MIRHALIALTVLAIALVCASAHAAITGATVGLDGAFWGSSIGRVDNSAQIADPYGVFTGSLDMATVNGWLTTGGVHSFALIPPAPGYLASASLPLAGVPGTGVQEMTLTLGDYSQVTVPLTNAAFITRGETEGIGREFYFDDMNYHDHESAQVVPGNGGPRPVLYQVDLSAYLGQSLASDPVLNLRGDGTSEPSRAFDAYEVTETYDYTEVTYGSLVYGGDIPELPPWVWELPASQDAYILTGEDTPNGTQPEHCCSFDSQLNGAIIYDFDAAGAGYDGYTAMGDGVLSVNVRSAEEPYPFLGVYELIGEPWDEATVTAGSFCFEGQVPNCLGEMAGGVLVENVGEYARQEISVAEATITKLINGEIRGLAISSGLGDSANVCIRTVNSDPTLGAEPVLRFTLGPPRPCYDPNCDGVFSDADYTIWADNYGATNATIRMGDMNGDGVVSDADYTIWADHYGQTCGSVPEPVTLAVFALGAMGLARRRH
jgi:hypothetical protein